MIWKVQFRPEAEHVADMLSVSLDQEDKLDANLAPLFKYVKTTEVISLFGSTDLPAISHGRLA